MRRIDPSMFEVTVNPADRFLERLQYVTMWLQSHSSQPPSGGLTDADPKTGEQWEWGQVWAHLAEFVPYWMQEVRRVLRWPGQEPVPFGRIKTDPGRVAAIERDRNLPAQELVERLNGQLADLGFFLDDIPSEEWQKLGVHQTLGVIDVRKIVEEFLIGHLEEHETQLRQLVDRSDNTGNTSGEAGR